jgi:hypothetical protein
VNASRRSAIRAEGIALLAELEAAVIDSWGDLLPAAQTWDPPARARAEAAARHALCALLELLGQGDLSEQAWTAAREAIFAHGHATREEAEELLRSVRVVGIDLLAGGLTERIGLTHDERWQLQQHAAAFADEILGAGDELDGASVEAMLAELQRSGVDLR